MKSVNDKYWQELFAVTSLRALYKKLAEFPASSGEWSVHNYRGDAVVTNEYFAAEIGGQWKRSERINGIKAADLILEEAALEDRDLTTGDIWLSKYVYNNFKKLGCISIFFTDGDSDNAEQYVMLEEDNNMIKMRKIED